jgi:1-acyl-sn-glycerol-3-phosphate acyltransferase
MLGSAEQAIEEGRAIVIFPEGTRTAPGERGRYQPGTAALYHRLGVPVVPVALDSGLFWGRRQFVKRPGTITIRFLPPIAPGLERRDFMATLEGRIEAECQALAGPSDSGRRD